MPLEQKSQKQLNSTNTNRLLTDRYSQLLETLSRLQATPSEALTRRLAPLSEDIHWLCLISGFTLFQVASADHSDAQQPRIPAELMAYSIHCSQFVDQALLDRLFATIAVSQSPTVANQSLLELPLKDSGKLGLVIKLGLSGNQLAGMM